ncbi:MAG TPA: allantoicase [Kiritimatiellia bacterium]|nr:allantoicase [Kiritimatiellia bacterium]
MAAPISTAAAFAGLVDLASERLGGKALAASDDFFAEKENLLKPGRGIFIEDKYTDRGKWMDGWESRRKRTPGHDWCVIQLGLPGTIRGVDVDTNHFLGNAPSFVSLDAATSPDGPWTEILPRSPVNPGAQNLFGVASGAVWTHVRLNIYPDGGVARFRVYGDVQPAATAAGALADLAALTNGGRAVACSDMFFSSMTNLIMPGRGVNMGDGWETKRRRGPGHDWVILQLARVGAVKKLEIDTAHFKGNFPDTASVDACHAPGQPVDGLTWPNYTWREVLPRQKLRADAVHVFEAELVDIGPVSHVRLNIYPDGGVSRFRVYGE